MGQKKMLDKVNVIYDLTKSTLDEIRKANSQLAFRTNFENIRYVASLYSQLKKDKHGAIIYNRKSRKFKRVALGGLKGLRHSMNKIITAMAVGVKFVHEQTIWETTRDTCSPKYESNVFSYFLGAFYLLRIALAMDGDYMTKEEIKFYVRGLSNGHNTMNKKCACAHYTNDTLHTDVFQLFQSSCYGYFEQKPCYLTCEEHAAKVCAIHNEAENNFVYKTFRSKGTLFIGNITYNSSHGLFWHDKSRVNFSSGGISGCDTFALRVNDFTDCKIDEKKPCFFMNFKDRGRSWTAERCDIQNYSNCVCEKKPFFPILTFDMSKLLNETSTASHNLIYFTNLFPLLCEFNWFVSYFLQ